MTEVVDLMDLYILSDVDVCDNEVGNNKLKKKKFTIKLSYICVQKQTCNFIHSQTKKQVS